LKDCDDIAEIFTGKRIKDLGKKAIELFGEDISKTAKELMLGKEEELPQDSPYRVLHVRPEASDIVVKARYRLLVRELHPEIGIHPDQVEFERVTRAYNSIMDARRKTRGDED